MAEKDNITGIAPALGGILIPIVVFVLIFAKDQTWILAPISFAFAILGIGVAYFASKTTRKK